MLKESRLEIIVQRNELAMDKKDMQALLSMIRTRLKSFADGTSYKCHNIKISIHLEAVED